MDELTKKLQEIIDTVVDPVKQKLAARNDELVATREKLVASNRDLQGTKRELDQNTQLLDQNKQLLDQKTQLVFKTSHELESAQRELKTQTESLGHTRRELDAIKHASEKQKTQFQSAIEKFQESAHQQQTEYDKILEYLKHLKHLKHLEHLEHLKQQQQETETAETASNAESLLLLTKQTEEGAGVGASVGTIVGSGGGASASAGAGASASSNASNELEQLKMRCYELEQEKNALQSIIAKQCRLTHETQASTKGSKRVRCSQYEHVPEPEPETTVVVNKAVKSMNELSMEKPKNLYHRTTTNECHRLIDALKKLDTFQVFHNPVSEGVKPPEDYREKIDNPMDLRTIKSKLVGLKYESVCDLIDDVRLMLNNCINYNGPENDYYPYTKRISEAFEQMHIVIKQ